MKINVLFNINYINMFGKYIEKKVLYYWICGWIKLIVLYI